MSVVKNEIKITSVQELMQLATVMYNGGCTPPGVDNPSKVAVCILAGLEIGLSPGQALGSIMLTGGKPSIYGDGAMALVLSSGLLEYFDEEVTGTVETGDLKSVCKAKRKGNDKVHVYEYTYKQAVESGLIERAKGKDGRGRGPWVSFPERMVRFRPRGYLFRDVFPDVLRGLTLAEEMMDALPEAPVVQQLPQATVATPALPVASETIPPSGQSATAPSVDDGKPTAEQKEELRHLQGQLFAAKLGPNPTDAQRSELWLATLAPYKAKSAQALTREQAADLIATLAKQYDFPKTSTT